LRTFFRLRNSIIAVVGLVLFRIHNFLCGCRSRHTSRSSSYSVVWLLFFSTLYSFSFSRKSLPLNHNNILKRN
jgi:hypothetical protein